MNAQFLNHWFTDQSIHAICWTLIHSVWIGMIASALAGIIIASTRKSTPLLRYRLLCSIFILFVIATAITLNNELEPKALDSATHANDIGIKTFSTSGTVTTDAGSALVINTVSILNRESGWIFAIWLICFALKSAQLVSNMFYIRRVRHHKIHHISEEWKNKVDVFSRKLGIRRKVTLLQSELVKVPVTIGFLKPVILLPVGMIFQLVPGQIDTILLHELAHIYRRDYLVNILQSIVEAIFFFNPAILWISALIREEREACCDDIVLENVTQKGNYLEALMAFQEHNSVPSGLALALSLRKPQLMNRLRRMVNKENQRLTMFEMSVLLAGMIFLSAFTFIPEVKPGIKNGVAYIGKAITHTLKIENPAKGKAPLLKITKPDVTENTTPLAADSLKFTSIQFKNSNADKANREMTVSDNQGNRYVIKIENNQLTALGVNGAEIAIDKLGDYQDLIRRIDLAWNQNLQLKMKAGADAKLLSDEKRKQEVAANQLAYKNKYSNNPPSSGAKTSNPDIKASNAIEKNLVPTSSGSTPPQKKKPAAPDISAHLDRVRGVIAVLISEQVVASQNDLDSFGLTDTELTVNGKKQPKELQQRLKEAYAIKPGYGLSYGPAKIDGGGIVIDKSDLK
jgi:bla regulator protein BlaR1